MAGIITELQSIHVNIGQEIDQRLAEFSMNNTPELIQKELFFCLLTPQSKARVCWDNVEKLCCAGVMQKGSSEVISNSLCGVRFRNNKARYIVEAREKCFCRESDVLKKICDEPDERLLRKYLAHNVKGMGFKEASHFLRNIGRGGELAILDRHILRGLVLAEVIERVPSALTEKKYILIEENMLQFSKEIDIPMADLDFVLWYFFKGEVFK